MSSKQLDISGLASFKSKGLNVPKEWIDEATREVNKSNNEKKLDSSEINKSKDSIIKEYEEDNFGEVTTELDNPEKVVNMYVYILGEDIMSDDKRFDRD